jgi:hypothetical protein
VGGFRYVLLCRHARHEDGYLVAVKNESDVWRFPTESVARALAEELVIGRDGLRLAKVVRSPTPEASRTASLILQRLEGKPAERTKELPPEHSDEMLTAGPAPATKQSPEQPDQVLTARTVRIKAPSWLQEPELKEVTVPAKDVQCEPWTELLPSRLYKTRAGALQKIKDELQALTDDSNALLVGWPSATDGMAQLLPP